MEVSFTIEDLPHFLGEIKIEFTPDKKLFVSLSNSPDFGQPDQREDSMFISIDS